MLSQESKAKGFYPWPLNVLELRQLNMVHIAVVGPGALGKSFAALGAVGGASVSLLGRPSAAPATLSYAFRPMAGSGKSFRCPEIPLQPLTHQGLEELGPVDLFVLALQTQQLEPSQLDLLSLAPILTLQPLLPRDRERLEAAKLKTFSAMPAIAAELDSNGDVSYFQSRFQISRIAEESRSDAGVSNAVQALKQGGLNIGYSKQLFELNAATTIAFFPWTVALACKGSWGALGADKALLTLTRKACREVLPIASRIGPIDTGVRFGTWALRPWLYPWALRTSQMFAPRQLGFLQNHFGHKLRSQHIFLGEQIQELAAPQSLNAVSSLLFELKKSFPLASIPG